MLADVQLYCVHVDALSIHVDTQRIHDSANAESDTACQPLLFPLSLDLPLPAAFSADCKSSSANQSLQHAIVEFNHQYKARLDIV